MTEDQIDQLDVFVTSSSTGRQMSYLELAREQFRHWNVSKHVVRRVLRSRGYERCIAQRKPPLTSDHMRRTKLWAEEHRNWTIEEWGRVLWTDETWVNGQRHSNTWVTRKVSNEISKSIRLTFDHSETKLLKEIVHPQGEKSDWLDVLGVFLWNTERAFSVLGEELGYYHCGEIQPEDFA